MKTYARIQDGVVVELLSIDVDITDRYHPALIWLDVTSVVSIAPGWQKSALGFLPPPAPPPVAVPTLAQLKAQLATIGAQLATLTATP